MKIPLTVRLLAFLLACASFPVALAQLSGTPADSVTGANGGTAGGASFSTPRLLSPSRPAAAPVSAATRLPSEPVLVDRIVAIVNAEAITDRELRQKVDSVSRRLTSQGITLPPPQELQRQLLERMVSDAAQQQAAREAGIRIDEVTIDRTVARIAQDSQMTVAQFRARLEADGVSFQSFRQDVANELTVSRFREREIDSRIQVSESEVDVYLAEQKTAAVEFNIAQILVAISEDAPAEKVAKARQQAQSIVQMARTGGDFARIVSSLSSAGEPVQGGITGMRTADRLPALFVEAVTPLKPGDVADEVRSPAGFHVLKLIERRGGGWSDAGSGPVKQTRVRHILIRVNELNSETEVIRRLKEIAERMRAGSVDFADMARQYSVDGSAGQGGDLGLVYQGDTVPEFERAMDALEIGQISEPVRSPFGYHLIQVTERRTDEASPERVRSATRNLLRIRKSNERFQEWTTEVRDRAYVEYRLDDQ
jgi:peptidyl-prolyl cis-trans isomerase SurA